MSNTASDQCNDVEGGTKMAFEHSTSILEDISARPEIEGPQLIKLPDHMHLSASPHWSLATRIAFRFFFVYFALYGFPYVISVLPGVDYLTQPYTALLYKLVPWIASHILHLSYPITIFPNGSGDTSYNYVELFLFAALAVVCTVLWSILDRKRSNYSRLCRWLRLWVRVAVGASLLNYGAMKVMVDQMSSPSLATLIETYGDSSPMRLLWTLIGASPAYQVFCGASEMLAGILLFIPAVTTLGALISIGVLTNVFMLNMCYDVPVKIYSFHLLLMSIFLLAPDVPRLFNLFFRGRTIKVSDDSRLFQKKWLNRGAWALQVVLGLYLAVMGLHYFHQEKKEFAVKPPYYGIWSVDEYVMDGNPHPPLLTDNLRWRRVILPFRGVMAVQLMDASRRPFSLALDQDKKLLTLSKFQEKTWEGDFSYQETAPGSLELDGKLDGHHIHAKLHREEESKFLLVSRGFHWINEYPYNR